MSLESYGAIMKISEHIRGLCPTIHLADITLKNPSKKFTAGKNVTCRVSAFVNLHYLKTRSPFTL